MISVSSTGGMPEVEMVSQNNDTVIWHLYVENINSDFAGYEVDAILVKNHLLLLYYSLKLKYE